MYDPLQASEQPAKPTNSSNVSSPPATPSKLKTGARPPPYQRPAPAQSSGSNSAVPPSQAVQAMNQHQPYPLQRSQSSMAPRPPLPGQAPRPVSPLHFQQQQQQIARQNESQGYSDPRSSLSPPAASGSGTVYHPSSATPFSPALPNAWSTSEPSTSISNSNNGRLPAPLPLPSPTGFGSPQRVTSPGIPRSPIAEQHQRPISSQTNHAQREEQFQKDRAPPFVRIRIQGIDRAKKELGIKMDCQTNIPTYHRQNSPIFSRTYAEFTALHGALSANHPETILPALPLAQTSATSEEEEDRFLRVVFGRFVDRICRDKAVVIDDELRSFVEADFGYTPITKAKKLKTGSGFLSRSSSRNILSENGEPDFLVSAKVHSAGLEAALVETSRALEKSLKAASITASGYADVSSAYTSYSTTEAHAPLAGGLKHLAEAMRAIAELDVGQCNATALVLGDALAYEAVEARSAKDALLQRQYNLDELHSSIKSTITKRRNIEKLRGSGNMKAERVNEALDDLEEAISQEKSLNAKVQAISNNLRPSLQNHVKVMNQDMLSTMVHHARTQLAYEGRKLQVYESVHDRIRKIPEKSAQEAVIHYHQPAAASTILPNVTPANAPLKGVALRSTAEETTQPLAQSAQTNGGPPTNSKFSSTQAQIKAAMEAQEAAEQAAKQERLRIRQQHLQQRQTQSQILPARQFAVPQSSSMANSLSANASASPLGPAAPVQQPALPHPGRSAPLDGIPTPSQANSPSRPLAQSMHSSPSLPAEQPPTVRSPPQSPLRSQVRPLPEARQNGHDPLSPLGTEGHLAQSSVTGPAFAPPAGAASRTTPERLSSLHDPRSGLNHGPASMTQSAFLPGRGANAGKPALNPIEERKRADARKAASLLAGAF